jgi:hypothetical protein
LQVLVLTIFIENKDEDHRPSCCNKALKMFSNGRKEYSLIKQWKQCHARKEKKCTLTIQSERGAGES